MRKRTPIALKVLEGNPGKRRIGIEPKPPDDGIPAPPCHLDTYALEEWRRVAEILYNMGVLTTVDQQTFAAYCAAYSRWRTAEEQIQRRVAKAKGDPLMGLIDETTNGNIIQNVLVGIANQASIAMVKYASEFGLTSAARARLAIDPGKKEGKFKGLIGNAGNK